MINISKESTGLIFTPSAAALVGFLCGCMSLATILGNLLVIAAFIVEKSLRSYSNYFILNLSITDLVVGVLIAPYMVFLLGDRRWIFGRIACKTWLILDYVAGSASVLCIVVISLDRYLLVSRGIEYIIQQKIWKAVAIIAIVWTVAFLNYGPAIILWDIISGNSSDVPNGECIAAFHNNLIYLAVSACVEFFLPFVTLIGLNVGVYLNIRRRCRGLITTGDLYKSGQSNKFTSKQSSPLMSLMTEVTQNPKSLKSTNKTEQNNEADVSMPFGKVIIRNQLNQKPNKSRLSKDKKAAQFLFIIVFVFVLCWVCIYLFDSVFLIRIKLLKLK